MPQDFTVDLLFWHKQENRREMPWKGEKDPYKIWISEIILQQTRVEQGLGYYERFVKSFPTLEKLAKAPEAKVFKLWEGLGYYSRCRNLLATARIIQQEYGGVFPSEYHSILKLKGIGTYTAAAIASFAFGLPYAVVDGNVYRVLSRYFGIRTPIDTLEGKKQFNALAQELLPIQEPGLYNQAIMDFGAVVCKPRQPLCTTCIHQVKCKAFQEGMVEKLPVKTKTIALRQRWFNYFILHDKDGLVVRQREQKDIWRDLYEFYLVEQEKPFVELKAGDRLFKKIPGSVRKKYFPSSRPYDQKLSHQSIHARFIPVAVTARFQVPPGYEKVPWRKVKSLPFPGIINQYLEQQGIADLKH
ncbi:MAG: A/G-specific adenine glycosylase [Bacteroidota bacterium]|jgi:A/G-specific adenine glycosylase